MKDNQNLTTTQRVVLAVCLLAMLLLIRYNVQAQGFDNYGFNDDEELFITSYVDPTFTDTGFQVGAGVRKELLWGWVGAEFSYLFGRDVPYWDLIGQGGLAFELGRSNLLGGVRLGRVDRGGNAFPLAGMIMIYEFHITNRLAVGLRLWVDHREDQKDQFFGNSFTYQPGLIFKGPLAQENGAIHLAWMLN